jgi:hypothetical protein
VSPKNLEVLGLGLGIRKATDEHPPKEGVYISQRC